MRGVCEKPRIQCAKCEHRKFIPVSDAVVRAHLTGRDASGRSLVMGLYPMLLDETCFLLAIDLDGNGWREDAMALTATCRHLGLPVALEISRSGNGAHLWFFFSEAVPARLARTLGSHVLTETMEHHPELGFDSYDRLFPNQDTLPKGGFGNLIALPLQAEARRSENSVFLDENMCPYFDQWAFLAGIQRLSHADLKVRVQQAVATGRVVAVRTPADEDSTAAPWTWAPSRNTDDNRVPGKLPEKIDAVLCDQLFVPKKDLTPPLRNCLQRLAAFQNPEFYRAQAMRLPTYGKPRVIGCAEDLPHHIALPRGCVDEFKQTMRRNGIKFRIHDKRHSGNQIEVKFLGQLRADQKEAKNALLQHDFGVLAATTAFGKTVLAAAIIAERGVNTLILVHRRQLRDQWVERLTEFLDLDRKDIGCLGAGRRKLKGKVDVAMLQSLVRKQTVDDRIAEYGQIIVDECHHVSAYSFELAVRRAKAKYVLGLSATVTRKDGHHPIIFMQCGPVRHHVGPRDHAETEKLIKQVIVRPTGFISTHTNDTDAVQVAYAELMDRLLHDSRRNDLICDDVHAAAASGCLPLVLTERTEHLNILADRLEGKGVQPLRMQGGMTQKHMRSTLAEIADTTSNGPRAIVATGRFVGEGFDVPELDSLFLAMPVSWKGTIEQYVGRLHRTFKGKNRVRVFDYADLDHPMLARMFDRRCAAYRQQGYPIMLPASAIPGWPAEVPLPIDTKWKQTYAASVQRLVRDGVDVPLAELFVQVTEFSAMEDKNGADRARSASEAFLFRRLESMPQTRGRFRLNTRLPIPFRGQSSMEVDFLDHNTRLAIELDGACHFQDLNAYRRDRCKDYLLQENGYCVLRFLAEDLGEHLDEVLDAILRAQAHQNQLTIDHI